MRIIIAPDSTIAKACSHIKTRVVVTVPYTDNSNYDDNNGEGNMIIKESSTKSGEPVMYDRI